MAEPNPMDAEKLSGPVLALLAADDPEDYFDRQQRHLGAQVWRSPADVDDTAWLTAAREALSETGQGHPVHVIAGAAMAARALRLVADQPVATSSLQLVDPDLDTNDPTLRDTMSLVETPTLVVVAAPDRATTFAKAQSIAGGVPNGVMVIIDDQQPPAHRTSPEAFNEWVTAFMHIAEGLYDMRSQSNEGVDQ
ncbi:alpha/beta fold hydrolase [Enemella sp. A6]|uniref:alpha/beta fold hydrolase n=1 Tax=Enemella sp. A6 TaxID=3440152 RepID=UPI003EB7AFB8